MMKKLKFVRYLPTRIKLMKQMKSIAKAEGATAFMGPLFEKSKQTPLKKLKSGTNKIVVKTVHFGFQPMIMEKDVRVPVRDGVCLLVNVFRPEKEGRYPVVLSADVYGKDPFFYPGQTSTTPALSGIGGVSTSMYTPFESPDPGFWVPNDYVLVKMAMRGTSDSDGDIAPFFSDVEAQDYADVINWAGTQPWSNGNVGTNGVSYLAVTQWQVAQLNAKHHKAMIPWEGFNDMYRDLVTHGGIPESLLVQFWSKIVTMKWPDKACEDVNAVLRAHPLYDEYWESKAAVLSKIKVPMLVGASWSTQGLHCRGSLEGFKQSSSELKWLYIHGRKEWEHYYQRENLERQKRFFDYFLKERKDNGWIDTPRVMVDVRERFFDGHFRYENEWPIARTQYTPLYLDAETSSLNISPVVKESKASYNSKNKSAEKNGQARFNITFDTETELT
ncbi:MAG: CocE/NonD family hydrolase, partial [Desulfatitalea sp.]|nr:CocE/NonD family hydrolase [Desulfatitalea sp.]